MKSDPAISNRDKPQLLSYPLVVHSCMSLKRFGKTPVGFSTHRNPNSFAKRSSKFSKLPNFSSSVAPLFPDAHANPAAQPVVQSNAVIVDIGNTEVVHPAPDILIQFVNAVFHRDSPATAGKPSELVFEVPERSLRPNDAFSLETKTKEAAPLGFPD